MTNFEKQFPHCQMQPYFRCLYTFGAEPISGGGGGSTQIRGGGNCLPPCPMLATALSIGHLNRSSFGVMRYEHYFCNILVECLFEFLAKNWIRICLITFVGLLRHFEYVVILWRAKLIQNTASNLVFNYSTSTVIVVSLLCILFVLYV